MAIVALVLIIGAVALGFLKFSTSPLPGGSTSQSGLCSSLPATQANPFKFTASGYNGETATGATVQVYNPANGYQTIGADNPGSLSSAVTSGQSYSPSQGLVAVETGTTAYPIDGVLGSAPITAGPAGAVETVTSGNAGTAGFCNWLVGFTPINAPASGTSATTNVQAQVYSTAGTALPGEGTVAGDGTLENAETWVASLNLLSASEGACYQVNVPSVPANTVVNYATGGTLPYGQTQAFQCVLELVINATSTNFIVNLDQQSTTAGLTMQAVTNPGMTANTQGYVVSGFTGCVPESANAINQACATAIFDVSTPGDPDSGHLGVTFIWVDMQQPIYTIQHATTPAVTSWSADDSVAGIPASFGGNTVPTGVPDGGAPAILIKQTYTAVLNF